VTAINRVVLLGNLTHDPELRSLPSGTAVCQLRLAVNDRVKDRTTGEWTDYANYFDVTVFGPQGERCAQYLARGRQVAVDGRLRWRSWETQDGQKRSKVEVVADTVQFVGPRDGGSGAPSGGQRSGGSEFPAEGGFEPADEDFGDDIPF
jgi:single-strand DNA-binding protein